MYGPKKINQALIDMKIQACERSWPQLVFLFLFWIIFIINSSMGVQLIIFPPRLNDFHRVVTYYIKFKKKTIEKGTLFYWFDKKKSVGQYN